MAHAIGKTNGKDSVMYVGETPWHKLGTKLPKLATSAEAIVAAGLDYEVKKIPVFFDANNERHIISGKFATVRTDSNEALGVVGKDYTVLQNKEAFEFFDAITGEGEAMFETAGALFSGQSVWMLAKLPDYIDLGGGDRIGKYLLLTNTHDGSRAVRAFFTPIRVVCNNTLNAALQDKSVLNGVSIRHSGNVAARVAEAGRLMGITNKVYAEVEEMYRKMSLTKVSPDELIKYVTALIPDNEGAKKNTRTEAIRSEVVNLTMYGEGASLETARGTLWGAYNGLTEYVDHVRGTNGKSDDVRLESMWFGNGARLKQAAYDLAVEMVKK